MRCGLVDELGSKDDGGHHARHEADGSDDDVPSDVDHYDDDGCDLSSGIGKSKKSLKIGKNRIKSEKSDLISYPTFWQKCQNAIKCHKMPKCLHFGSGSCIRIS